MANLGQTISTTLFDQSKEVADEVMHHHPLLMILKEKGKVKFFRGGYEIRKVVAWKDDYTGGSYSGYDNFTLPQSNDLDAFQYTVKSLQEGFGISGRELRANADKEKLVDLVDELRSIAINRLKNMVSVQLLGDGTGNSGKDLDGIIAHISADPTTGTLGKIDRSIATNDWARNFSKTVAGGLTAANVLAETSAAISENQRGSMQVDCALAGGAAWQLVHDALTPLQRITDNTSRPKQGFREFEWDGVRYFNVTGYGVTSAAKAAYGTNAIRFINTDFMSFDIEREANFVPLDELDRPEDQDGYYTQFIVEGNLCSSAPVFNTYLA